MHPEDLKYSPTHEWVRVEDSIATIGITDHAQSELGDVVFVELPEVGAMVEKGSMFGTIESVKTVSDLMSPITGEVIEVNEDLPETPEVVNESPYTSGWMIKLRLSNPAEMDKLMTTEQYEDFLRER